MIGHPTSLHEACGFVTGLLVEHSDGQREVIPITKDQYGEAAAIPADAKVIGGGWSDGRKVVDNRLPASGTIVADEPEQAIPAMYGLDAARAFADPDSRSLCRLYPHQILALVKAEADGLVKMLGTTDWPASAGDVTRDDVEKRLSEIVRLTAMLPEVLPR